MNKLDEIPESQVKKTVVENGQSAAVPEHPKYSKRKEDLIDSQSVDADVEAETEAEVSDSNSSDGSGEEVPVKHVEKIKYILTAVVCHIDDKTSDDRRHAVALIRVGPNYHERSTGSAVAQWYLFNDFSITAVTPQEAVWFNLDWKVPCVLHYTAVNATESQSFVSPLTADVFGEDKCIARSGGTRGITFTPLTSDEMPNKGNFFLINYLDVKQEN